MVDRQDIDALLVGSLYGELTPADEARLAAHLESHPADRAALEDLKTARHAVRESRFFEEQLEPPQAVSALLLQEAHRRAPKPARARSEAEHEGWFARFARSFFAHPAMAAAAMLVLVVGVAGTLYMRNGSDSLAVKELPPPAETAQNAAPTAADPHGAAGTAGDSGERANDLKDLEAAAGSAAGYQVQLAEGQAGKLEQKRDEAKADKAPAPIGKAGAKNTQLAFDDGDAATPRKQMAPTAHTAKKPADVRSAEPSMMPKELDAPAPKAKGAARSDNFGSIDGLADSRGAAGGGAAGPSTGFAETATVTQGRAPGGAPPQAAPSPPPPPSAVASAKPMAPSAAPPPAKADPQPQSTALLGWARGQLAHAIELARAGTDNCREVAQVTRTIHDRAPAFYAQEVADNRELRSCVQYMRAQAEQSEDRAKRAAPAKTNMNDSLK